MSEPTRQQKILLQQQKQREAAQKRREEAQKKRQAAQEAQKNRRVRTSKARNIQGTTRRQTTTRGQTTRRVNNQLKDAQACIHNQGETGNRVPVG